jgi:hypothetical protein
LMQLMCLINLDRNMLLVGYFLPFFNSSFASLQLVQAMAEYYLSGLKKHNIFL